MISLNEINKNKSIIYLTNSLGEETGFGEIPEAVMTWYESSCVNNTWLQYLVNNNGKYGILAIQEIAHPESEHWDESKFYYSPQWQGASAEEIITHLNKTTKTINQLIDFDVLLGEETGIFAVHEVCIFIPFKTTKIACIENFDKIEDIDLYF